MVNGIDKFKEAFSKYSDCYVIIGGTACDYVLRDTSMKPRATVDIDMILVVENMTKSFAKDFWQFIRDGGYKNGKRKRDEDKEPVYELYRFTDSQLGYPIQIELLSHHSAILGEPSGFHIEPIPTEEEISSMSAIIMDEDYYNLTIKHSYIDDGLRIADSTALICLKAQAHLNLLTEKKRGNHVNSKDIKKHRNDILKLIATSTNIAPITVTEKIKTVIDLFAEYIRETLPSQSLEDTLELPSEEIRELTYILQDSFISQ